MTKFVILCKHRYTDIEEKINQIEKYQQEKRDYLSELQNRFINNKTLSEKEKESLKLFTVFVRYSGAFKPDEMCSICKRNPQMEDEFSKYCECVNELYKLISEVDNV